MFTIYSAIFTSIFKVAVNEGAINAFIQPKHLFDNNIYMTKKEKSFARRFHTCPPLKLYVSFPVFLTPTNEFINSTFRSRE